MIDFFGAHMSRISCPLCPSAMLTGDVGRDVAVFRCRMCGRVYHVGFGRAPVLRVEEPSAEKAV